jgi:hypothetical protein
MEAFVDLPNNSGDDLRVAFENTIKIARLSLGDKAFRPQSALNTAVFDSVMVGITERLRKGPIKDLTALKTSYDNLLQDPNYFSHYNRATADESSVTGRMDLAVAAFANII